MAFSRVKRHLSALASGSNNRRSRTTEQTRSTSGSTASSTFSTDPLPKDENSSRRTRECSRSVTHDKLLSNDGINENLALTGQERSPAVKAAQGRRSGGISKGQRLQYRSTNAGGETGASKGTQSLSPGPVGGSLEPLPHKPGNPTGRTTLSIGKPDAPAFRPSVERHLKDESRLEAEQEYYESVGPSGTSRRRSMLRSVSRDDYLLARGANPRTGLVTPGINSATSSYEDELLRQRGIAPPSKWRQRGDQWVSLDLGEPTPLPSPPRERTTHHTGRPLRTPPRLTAGKYNQGSHQGKVYQKPHISAALPKDAPTPDGIPGNFPISPTVKYSPATTQTTGGPVIKRKPVANNSPSKDPDQDRQTNPQNSTDTVIKHSPATPFRSSSAPAPKLFPFETPEDVGMTASKPLPSMPNPAGHRFYQANPHVEFEDPFLGQRRPKEATDLAKPTPSALFRPEKELPCLPMNSGQSPSRAWEQVTDTKPQDMYVTKSYNTGRVMGPRGGDPAYPFSRTTRPTIPPRHHQLPPKAARRAVVRMPATSIPIYDNPPSTMTVATRPVRGMIGGPRPMHHSRSASNNTRKASDIHEEPHVTMSINTPTLTPMSTLQPEYQSRTHSMASGFEASHRQRHYYQSPVGIRPVDPRQSNRNATDNMALTWPANRPRAQSRPQMPDRADAQIGSVPRMIPRRHYPMGSTEGRHRLRMVGTSEQGVSEQTDIKIAATTSQDDERTHVLQTRQPTIVGRTAVLPASFRSDRDQSAVLAGIKVSGTERGDHLSQNSGQMRNCSRCRNGFVVNSPRNIAGYNPTSGTERAQITREVEHSMSIMSNRQGPGNAVTMTEPTVAPSSASTEREPVDERDHTACCTECCTVEDCHEGCVGHPSPSVRSFDGSTVIDVNSLPSSPERSPALTPTARNSSPKQLRQKLSFVQNLRMRKTLRTRQCPDDGKTIRERCNALESPPIELDSHPLSPGSFWGGGESAVAAAKKAIGSKRQVTAPPATNGIASAKSGDVPPPLVIPKIRQVGKCNASEGARSAAPTKPSKTRNVSATSNPSAHSNAARSRNASGASILSIEIPHIFSTLGAINVAGAFELSRVPFEVAAMWIRNHPEVKQWLWNGVEKGIGMARTVVATAGTLWEVSYVYSKTGKLRSKSSGGIGSLLVDCGRSVGYLLVFLALAMAIGRVLSVLLGLAQGLFCVVQAAGWVLKGLGLGVLW